jgi:hypothetical protein
VVGLYSSSIAAIAAWLERNGVTVKLHSDELPADIAGRYDDGTQTIWVASTPSARDALLTIAHEAGHWLGYLIKRKPHTHQRERQAYVYGWYVLQWFDAPITRAEWVTECREAELHRRSQQWSLVLTLPWLEEVRA